jgi:hypothetical protein
MNRGILFSLLLASSALFVPSVIAQSNVSAAPSTTAQSAEIPKPNATALVPSSTFAAPRNLIGPNFLPMDKAWFTGNKLATINSLQSPI